MTVRSQSCTSRKRVTGTDSEDFVQLHVFSSDHCFMKVDTFNSTVSVNYFAKQARPLLKCFHAIVKCSVWSLQQLPGNMFSLFSTMVAR